MNKRSVNTKNNPVPDTPATTSLARELWLGTCARYTVLCLLLLLISAIVSDSLTVTYVDTVRFFLLLPFAFCLAVATKVRKAPRLSTGAKCALHPVLFLGGFYLFCYLPFQISTKPSGQQILILLILVALLYGISMGIFCLISRSLRQKKIDDTPYVSQFQKK